VVAGLPAPLVTESYLTDALAVIFPRRLATEVPEDDVAGLVVEPAVVLAAGAFEVVAAGEPGGMVVLLPLLQLARTIADNVSASAIQKIMLFPFTIYPFG
jgi:hypothetical protein